jgi:hypothetical protein
VLGGHHHRNLSMLRRSRHFAHALPGSILRCSTTRKAMTRGSGSCTPRHTEDPFQATIVAGSRGVRVAARPRRASCELVPDPGGLPLAAPCLRR